MPRVVPSQVVAFIDRAFPKAKEGVKFDLTAGNSNMVAAMIDLVDGVPDELVRLQGEEFAMFRVALTACRNQIESWRIKDTTFSIVGGLPAINPICLIRSALEKCPEEAPAPGTTELAFIPDAELRESIRLDINESNSDLIEGNWKGATVLAGSAVEALLLWALQEHERGHSGALMAAAAARVAAKRLTRQPPANPEQWMLAEYIEVAEELGRIEDGTATQARQAKDFRNLIHPGRAARLGQKCDRGTALAAMAAIEFVVRDLTP